MKVVLSRKGMDSQYGGIPSPIILSEHGYQKFYSIPIPYKCDALDLKYSDLILTRGFSVQNYIDDIKMNYNQGEFCHLDPDLRESYLEGRPEGWNRSFGQVGHAQSHLEKNSIGPGDIFLFYGWFKFVELVKGKFRFSYNSDYPNGFHAIFGYLQVDKVLKPNSDEIPLWLKDHPHAKFKGISPFNSQNNTIYTSSDFFKHDKASFKKNGSICFSFSDDLILTKRGSRNKSLWELPDFFHPDFGTELTYNKRESWSWENGNSILSSAHIGQEFVVKSDPNGKVENWCIDLIRSHSVTD